MAEKYILSHKKIRKNNQMLFLINKHRIDAGIASAENL